MNGGPPAGAGTEAAKTAGGQAPEPEEGRDVLREVSGSENREFTEALVQAVADSLWLPPGGAAAGPERGPDPKLAAAVAAVRAFRPRDAVEGLMAA